MIDYLLYLAYGVIGIAISIPIGLLIAFHRLDKEFETKEVKNY